MYPVLKKLFCIVFCLSLLASFFSGCTQDEPYPPIVPGSWSIEDEIIYHYYTQETSADFQMQYPQDRLSLRFRGVFNDSYVVFVDGPFDYSDGMTYEYVNSWLFIYPNSQRMLAYHQGQFYLLADAFHAGYLTAANVAELYQNYLKTDANKQDKGQVPTVREECTHTPPEPTTESTPPVTVTQPTEPDDNILVLPDIPAFHVPCSKPENLTTETLVYTLYDHGLSWADNSGIKRSVYYKLPAIVYFCDGAAEINEAIRQLYQADVQSTRKSYQNKWPTANRNIDYSAFICDDVLRICIYINGTLENQWYLDLTTGQMLKTPELAMKYLQESYPVFLHHCTNNLIEYFTANPLEDPQQQSLLIKSLTNEIPFCANYRLYLDADGTLLLDVQVDGICINSIVYYAIHRSDWDYTEQDSYRWLFYLLTDGEGAEQQAQDLKTSFFQDPFVFVEMLSQEYSGTIQQIARQLNYSMYSLEEIERYKVLCDDVYILTEDETVRKTASTLLAFANTLSNPPQ